MTMRDRATLPGPVRTTIAAGRETLALHTWDDGRAGLADLFYIHGLQSHAGWLFETGPALLKRGVRLSVLDRRGSGGSSGVRGHLENARTVLDDYGTVLARVVATAGAPVSVLGQSFGGSLLAAMVATGRIEDNIPVVLCAPALGQHRVRLDNEARSRMLKTKGAEASAVQIEDEQYTCLPGYLRLMANDGLMVRSLTDSCRATMVEIEDLYFRMGTAPWADRSVWVALPKQDSIIDLGVSLKVVESLAPHAVLRRFSAASHYLEFTESRVEYWDWLAGIVREGSTC